MKEAAGVGTLRPCRQTATTERREDDTAVGTRAAVDVYDVVYGPYVVCEL